MALPVAATYVFRLNLNEVEGNGWQMRGIELELIWHSRDQVDLRLSATQLQLPPPLDSLTNVSLSCRHAHIRAHSVRCPRGVLHLNLPLLDQVPIDIAFSYQHASRELHLTLKNIAFAHGKLDMEGRTDEAGWQLEFAAEALDATQLAGTLTDLSERVAPWLEGLETSGQLNLQGRLSGQNMQLRAAELDGTVEQFHFTDKEGLRAGEQLTSTFTVRVKEQHNQWQLQAELTAHEGQLYIEPIFLEVPDQPIKLILGASWQPKEGEIDISYLRLDHPGTLHAEGQLDLLLQDTANLKSARLEVVQTPLTGLYQTYLQPFLIGTAIGNLDSTGQVSLTLDYQRDGETSAKIVLDRVHLDDRQGRYGLHGLTGTLAWTSNETSPAISCLSWQDGYVYRLTLGASQLAIEARGHSVRLLEGIALPVLDGALRINSFTVENPATPEMKWQFEGLLTPISMEALSQALGWPTLSGKLSGVIPKVSYTNGTVEIDGALQVQAFAGTVRVHNLRLEQPFGIVPKLFANIDLDTLDLETLTSTFSFGKIQGKLSGRIHKLRLEDWQPVHFAAQLATPADDRSRHRISQKAVDNLVASLGGVRGALSRGLMRFFDEFSYDRLGLSCHLEKGICEMDGLEPTDKGYYIVKGSGLPRINVIGYTRRVNWANLLERLKRVTSSAAPAVQ